MGGGGLGGGAHRPKFSPERFGGAGGVHMLMLREKVGEAVKGGAEAGL